MTRNLCVINEVSPNIWNMHHNLGTQTAVSVIKGLQMVHSLPQHLHQRKHHLMVFYRLSELHTG